MRRVLTLLGAFLVLSPLVFVPPQPTSAQIINPSCLGTATLTWVPPTEDVNGFPTTIQGYVIYIGTSPATYSQSINIPDGGLSVYVVDGLCNGTYYFAATAYNSAGESTYSNEDSKTISNGTPVSVPLAPTGLSVQ